MKVLITGGSGLIGSELTRKFIDNNIDCVHLSRVKNSKLGVKTYVWDYKRNYLEDGALKDVTHIVHLAGAGIADKPWTMSRKRTIVKSRVLTARLLREYIEKNELKLDAFISASGIGYYGAVTSSHVYKESDQRGHDFVSECCVQWEDEVNKFKNTRVAILRTGIVLSKEGGALQRIESAINRRIGAPLGSGKQHMPWIHIDDMVQLYYDAVTRDKYEGIYNAVSNEPMTNEELTRNLAKHLGRKLWLPNVPAFMVKTIFGELSEILLEGSHVSNQKLLDNGFEFKFKEFKEALDNIYKD